MVLDTPVNLSESDYPQRFWSIPTLGLKNVNLEKKNIGDIGSVNLCAITISCQQKQGALTCLLFLQLEFPLIFVKGINLSSILPLEFSSIFA